MGESLRGVWLDARGTQSAAHAERGIARYIAEQTHALIRLRPDLEISVGLDPDVPVPSTLESLGDSGHLKWHSREEPDVDRLPSIYHVMSPFESNLELADVWPAWARKGETRTVVTLYDLIPLVMRDRYLTDANWGVWGTVWMARLGLIRSADHVLTISRRTADDAIEHLGIPDERITVIDSGVSWTLSELAPTEEVARSLLDKEVKRLRPGFLLYVGGDDPRKNLEGTIQAYALLPEELRRSHQLAIVCNLTLARRAQLLAHARGLGIKLRDLVLPGFVPDDVLASLYRACGLFIFPSLYEGAGLPILEAMACGAPVAASATSSIPEILGDLDATFDPSDAADIARCIADALASPGALDRLRERSARRVRIFTWDRVAELTLDGYERALGAEPTAARPAESPASA
ncbi:MAG: glycosyltransferase family 4 protein [Solirubrobacterales bacterium]